MNILQQAQFYGSLECFAGVGFQLLPKASL